MTYMLMATGCHSMARCTPWQIRFKRESIAFTKSAQTVIKPSRPVKLSLNPERRAGPAKHLHYQKGRPFCRRQRSLLRNKMSLLRGDCPASRGRLSGRWSPPSGTARYGLEEHSAYSTTALATTGTFCFLLIERRCFCAVETLRMTEWADGDFFTTLLGRGIPEIGRAQGACTPCARPISGHTSKRGLSKHPLENQNGTV